MILRLRPPPAAVVEAEAGMWEESGLLPEEAAAVERAVQKRRREYAAGRACARRALARLGLEPSPLLNGPDRAPIWPRGTIGSITHCAGYCAAAVAWTADLRGLGIDAELNRPLPDGVTGHVCTEREREWSSCLPADEGINWPTLVFSAKESVYKAWYPLTRRWLGYLDAEIAFDPGLHTFRARLLVPAPGSLGPSFEGFDGLFAATREHLFTAVLLPLARGEAGRGVDGKAAAAQQRNEDGG